MSKEVGFCNRDRFIELGLTIASLRKMQGLSQEKLAEKGDQKIFSQSAPGRKVHFVLFDYGKRSPVDFEAFSQVVEENGTARKGGEHAHSICGG